MNKNHYEDSFLYQLDTLRDENDLKVQVLPHLSLKESNPSSSQILTRLH